MTALAHQLTRYDRDAIHGTTLTAAEIAEVTDRLLGWDHAQRSAQAVIHPGRVDVIAAGAVILRTIVDWAALDRITASETDILDGIALTT